MKYGLKWLGYMHKKKQWDNVEHCLKQALAYQQGNVEIYIGLGTLLIETQKYEEASKILTETLELAPTHLDALQLIFICLNEQIINHSKSEYKARFTEKKFQNI